MESDNLEQYLSFYEKFDMTCEEKIKHIQALYDVVGHLVDATFDNQAIFD